MGCQRVFINFYVPNTYSEDEGTLFTFGKGAGTKGRMAIGMKNSTQNGLDPNQ